MYIVTIKLLDNNDEVALRQLYSHHKTPGHNDEVALRQL